MFINNKNNLFQYTVIVIFYFEFIIKPILFVFGSGLVQLLNNFVVVPFILLIFLLLYSLRQGGRIKLNSFFLVTVSLSLFYFGLGLLKGSYLKDGIAGVFFFIAPFLGYYIGSIIFSDVNVRAKALTLFLKFSFYSLIIGILGKIGAIVAGRPFVVYAGVGFDMLPSAFFFVGYLLITYKFKLINYSKWYAFAIFIFLVVQILVPVVRPFKASLIMMIVWLGPLLIYCYGFGRSFFLFLLFLPFVLFYFPDLEIFQRFLESFYDLSDSSSKYDDKRYAEIVGVIDTLSKNSFIDFIFGNGTGARWYATNFNFNSIMRFLDMREDGGVHHVHVTWMALLFRHGFVGIFLYLTLIITFFLKLTKYRDINYLEGINQNAIQRAMIFYLISLLSGSLVDWQFYSDAYTGFLVSMCVPYRIVVK